MKMPVNDLFLVVSLWHLEVTFKEERIFGQDEVDEICSTFRLVQSGLY